MDGQPVSFDNVSKVEQGRSYMSNRNINQSSVPTSAVAVRVKAPVFSTEMRHQQARSSQSIAKKAPYSQRPAELNFDGASSKSDDVAFLRLPQVKAITGLSKSSLYALIREKSFPAPVRLGARAVAWIRSEVNQWASERVHASRSVA